MKTRLTASVLAALVVGLFACAVAGAAMVTIYRNGMDTTANRSEMVKVSGRSCRRGGIGTALQIEVGKMTASCSYRTPVLGRDLEISASERLSSASTRKLQKQAYLGLELRAGGGAKYQLLVYPLQRKVQIAKVTKEGTEFLAIAKNQKVVQGLDKPNNLRFRVAKIGTGEARLVGSVGSTLVARGTDSVAGELPGRFAGVTVGASKNASGVIAGIDDVTVRIPSPY
jgi:hypothetical protein